MDFSRDSRARLLLLTVGVGLLVMLFGVGFDSFLARNGVRRGDILAFADGLTGLVAGILFYTLVDRRRRRQREVEERLRVIADLNHHIRNALQVITYATAQSHAADSMNFVRDSVDRITWALRELLPEYQTAEEPAPAPKSEVPSQVRG